MNKVTDMKTSYQRCQSYVILNNLLIHIVLLVGDPVTCVTVTEKDFCTLVSGLLDT